MNQQETEYDYYSMRGEVLAEALERMRMGAETYADKDFTLNEANLMARDVVQDIIEEHLDLINYNITQIIKLRLKYRNLISKDGNVKA